MEAASHGGFEILDHTADLRVRAFGKDLQELFANAALAMFSLMADPSTVRQRQTFEIAVSGTDLESLLVSFLSELIYLAEVESVLFSAVRIRVLEKERLQAQALGEAFDPARHERKESIKAATYHGLAIEKNDAWHARIIFDV